MTALCCLVGRDGGLSIVAKNVEVMGALRAHHGDWAAALAAFQHDRQVDGLGVALDSFDVRR